MENQKLLIRGKNDLPFVCFQTVSNSQSILPQRIQIIIQIQSVYPSSKTFKTLTKVKRVGEEHWVNDELMGSDEKFFFFFSFRFQSGHKKKRKKENRVFVMNEHVIM